MNEEIKQDDKKEAYKTFFQTKLKIQRTNYKGKRNVVKSITRRGHSLEHFISQLEKDIVYRQDIFIDKIFLVDKNLLIETSKHYKNERKIN